MKSTLINDLKRGSCNPGIKNTTTTNFSIYANNRITTAFNPDVNLLFVKDRVQNQNKNPKQRSSHGDSSLETHKNLTKNIKLGQEKHNSIQNNPKSNIVLNTSQQISEKGRGEYSMDKDNAVKGKLSGTLSKGVSTVKIKANVNQIPTLYTLKRQSETIQKSSSNLHPKNEGISNFEEPMSPSYPHYFIKNVNKNGTNGALTPNQTFLKKPTNESLKSSISELLEKALMLKSRHQHFEGKHNSGKNLDLLKKQNIDLKSKCINSGILILSNLFRKTEMRCFRSIQLREFKPKSHFPELDSF